MHLLRSLVTISSLILLVSCGTMQQFSQTTTAYSSDPWDSVMIPEWYDPAEFDTISVVTWNLEHFVDDYDNPYIDNDRENNPGEGLDERRALLAYAIEKIDADVIVFQEIESAAYASVLSDEHFEQLGYRLFTGRESSDWYMNVVIMSRLPLGILYSYANISTPIEGQMTDEGEQARQHFTNNRMVSVDVLVNPDYTFTLTGVHLKAGRGDRNEGWRMGQINLLRSHYSGILSSDPDAMILFTGDLNMQPGDPEYSLLMGEGTSVRFVDPLADVESLTHPANDPTRQLDYVLPNEQMMESLVEESSRVLTPLDTQSMRKISDHLPVIARFVTTN